MRDDEVLPPRLSHQAWVARVLREVLRRALPKELKHFRGACKVDAGEVPVAEQRIGYDGRRTRHEIDHARRQTSFLEQLQHKVVREHGRGRRFPDDGVAHDRGGGGEVAADRGEVEGRDRVHEPLERPVLHGVPRAGHGQRLLVVHPLRVVHVETEEVNELASGIDLSLMGRL